MLTGKEDLLQSLIEIYLMEKGINQFYSELSVKAKSSEARKTFTALANWEAEHVRHIQNFYQTLMDERDPASFDEFAKKARPDVAEGGTPLTELERKTDEFRFLDDIGAIQFALNVEADEYNLYRKLAAKTDDSNVKALCKEFMGWEQDHIKYLKKVSENTEKTSKGGGQ
ncbi:MAG TPA: ferritin family protein [Candidatus Sulfobium mesophilum]|jgi:rubrerythrin|nr:ferritin family protein [Candidatus Sulfobium mesophilum]